MPRTKTATSSKRNQHKKKRSSGRSKHVTLSSSPASSTSSSLYSAQQLLDAAEAALASDTTHAIALYTAALQKCHAEKKQQQDVVDPALVLEKRAEARVAAADPEGALDDYRQALQELVRPTEATKSNKDSPPEAVALERQASLLCYMGQLSGGHESLQCYQQAIERLQQRLAILQQPQSSSSIETTQQHLSAACCGAAEVYLTDLCWEEDAEQRCEAWVQQALDACDPPTLDALQTAASLRLSQCRGAEATQFIQTCFARMQVPCEALRRLVGLRHVVTNEGSTTTTTPLELSPDETTAVQALPGFEFRTQTAKLLLECSAIAREHEQNTTTAHVECAEAAVTVLASLLAENDEVIELWYLCGDAFAALEDVELAVYYYQRTAEMLQSVQQSLEQQQQDDDEEEVASSEEEEAQEEELQQQLDEVTCQLEDVQQKLQALQQQQQQQSSADEQDNTVEPMDQDDD